MTTPVQSLLTAAQVAQAPTPAPSANNPHRLTPEWLAHFGPDAAITPQWAWDNWAGEVNPFLINSQNYFTLREMIVQHNQSSIAGILKYPDVPVVVTPSKRRVSQTRLKFQFDSLSDIRLRLANTLIFIGKDLFYVRDIRAAEHDYAMVVEDAEGTRYKTWYKENGDIDLRTPEPQYFQFHDRPAWLMRWPARVQKQGLSTDVCQCRHVGDAQPRPLGQFRYLMKGLSMPEVTWNEKLSSMMAIGAVASVRLSKEVAAYRDDKTGVPTIEYRGRLLGPVMDDTVVVDPSDYEKPWINRDIKMIGCTLRKAA